jgi:hypothetical protein
MARKATSSARTEGLIHPNFFSGHAAYVSQQFSKRLDRKPFEKRLDRNPFQKRLDRKRGTF